ncbi:hypothetical protein [Turicibacter sanguinis]|uniref:hypothetical protein n=1 Tax=Turicibacter sanguinis TaxID=154288 RepID=UPI0018A8B71B|nr:hypothetical protein [Turicibacter sanguinis]MDB8553243.1 hypothetical protein [Turicibacter sanguinis]
MKKNNIIGGIIILVVLTVCILSRELLSFNSHDEFNIHYPEKCYIESRNVVEINKCHAALFKDAANKIDKFPLK